MPIEEHLDFSLGQAIVGVPEFRGQTRVEQRGATDDAQAVWTRDVDALQREYFGRTDRVRADAEAREQIVRAQSSADV